jgi:hypothetical protein
MLIKPCPPCCDPGFPGINVPDNFFELTNEEQRNLLVSLSNSHSEWQKTINTLTQFIDDGNHISNG